MSMTWRRVQGVVFWILVVSGLLAVGAATGLTPIPKGPPSLAWKLHPVLLVLGFGCGLAAVARSREIDRERWRVLGDVSITSGERDWAHREAESEIRSSGTVFVLAGVALGAFGAYQLRDPDALGAADFLIVSPLIGFAVGLLVGLRVFPPVAPGV
ncbi:MAG TPA: hypothetical protein VNB06_20280 [Thermoanaerobaculia bacterium]|nr:hypothetical protein [Thermoanaerobaculia bacterium]